MMKKEGRRHTNTVIKYYLQGGADIRGQHTKMTPSMHIRLQLCLIPLRKLWTFIAIHKAMQQYSNKYIEYTKLQDDSQIKKTLSFSICHCLPAVFRVWSPYFTITLHTGVYCKKLLLHVMYLLQSNSVCFHQSQITSQVSLYHRRHHTYTGHSGHHPGDRD